MLTPGASTTPEPAAAFDGRVYIADKSAWARSHHVADEWARALRDGQIATCSIVVLELLYSARNAVELEELEEELSQLRNVPINAAAWRVANGALKDLSHVSDKYHRVAPPDVLVAAAAQEAALGVLHYDKHFDRLAEVLHFESRWIVPPGTAD